MSISQFSNINVDDSVEQNYKVIIAGLQGGPVSGAISNDFALAGGNDFSTFGELLRGVPGADKVLAAKDLLAGAANISGRSATTELETRKVWNNSLIPDIPIEIELYQANADQNSIMEKIRRIKSAVYPNREGRFFSAPLGYKFAGQNSNTATGTLTVTIGTWFRASGLIMASENVTWSKEVNVNGQPISAFVTMTFQPFRAITYNEFLRWIQ